MTDQITIPSALLKQALNALTSFEQNYGSLWYSSYEPDQIDATCSSLRAELAKPSATPAWHDAPTEPGWWVRNSYEGIGVYSISEPSIKFLKGSAARWYGPIPQDTKAEGEST